MPRIRFAGPADAPALACLAEKTFRDTFGAMNTASDMDLHCRSSYGQALQLAELQDPRARTLVGECKGALIAYAQLRWGEAPPCVRAARPGEIHRLYVLEGWQGKGIAQALMAAALTELEARGVDAAWLGVWEHNPRAQAFYRKSGFQEVGSHVFPLGTDLQRDLIWVRRLQGVPREGSGAASAKGCD